MVKRESPYKNLRLAIDQGDMQSFDGLLMQTDQRMLFRNAKLNPYGPGRKRINDPRTFTIAEVYQLVAVMGVPGLKLLEMIDYDIGRWVKFVSNR